MKTLLTRTLRTALAAAALAPAAFLAAAWNPVPPADFSGLKPSDFTDLELDVPYHLFHFSRIANAVVEEGPDRGFPNIAVNREPRDNKPHNARIQEMQLAVAYFYTARRPWNRYYGSPEVRNRLEAMFERWPRIQNQPGPEDGNFDGLFAEYSPTNWSQAPTSFGALAAAGAVDLVIRARREDADLGFSEELLEGMRVALRRALMAVFTRPDMRSHARQWSNQFSGTYNAALIYLSHWPDEELDRALVRAVNDSVAQDQSPAGFFYEQGGPDFGYSGVHDNNLRIALPGLRARQDLLTPLIEDDVKWNDWLAANFVLQPGRAQPVFLTNAGINTRTSHSIQTPRSRPLSEFAVSSRAFSLTQREYEESVAARRAALESVFGKWGPLRTPDGYSYNPGFVHGTVVELNAWHPTESQRAEAIAAMPSNIKGAFNRQIHDPLPLTITVAKRDAYQALVNTGRVRVPRQILGLGTVWNPRFGIAVQPVSGTNWVYGTRPATEGAKTYETRDLNAKIRVSGNTVAPRPGNHPLPAGDVEVFYMLGGEGRSKRLLLGSAALETRIEHAGAFEELIPLAYEAGSKVTAERRLLRIERKDGSRFLIEIVSGNAELVLGDEQTREAGISRRMLTLRGKNSLVHRMTFR